MIIIKDVNTERKKFHGISGSHLKPNFALHDIKNVNMSIRVAYTNLETKIKK